jgi:hypothetical protein
VVDEAFRVVFDDLYALQGGEKPDKPSKPSDLEAQVKRATALAVARVGPGAGTYVVGAKLTPAGQNGTITIDDQGRVTAVQQAT